MISANIIEGVVIGVSSGLILSLFFGGKDFVNKRIERQDQIKYLVQLITKYRDLICKADTEYLPAVGQKAQKSELRKAYYDDLRRQLEAALQNRTSRLSYDEIKEVRDVFFTDLFPSVVLNDEGYNNIFEGLKSIKWLKLPPRTT